MQVLNLGDGAFTVQFADTFDPEARRRVARLNAAIEAAGDGGPLEGVVATTPTFRSLTIHYDPLVTRRAELEATVRGLLDDAGGEDEEPGRDWCLPVAYGGEAGPDLEAVAEAAGLTTTETIDLHAGTPVHVYMLGFLPGFPFMGDIPEALRRPRLSEPRTRVPAGTVAVAGRLTAIYPWESPGGWHLLGRCPVPLFDAAGDPPALLAAADRVRFEPTDGARVDELARAVANGELAPASFREGS